MYLTVDDAKRHMNIDVTFTGDDAYIADLIEVAEDAVARHIDRPLSELEQADGRLPAGLTHALRFFVGQLYANREPVSFASAVEIPLTYDYLVSQFRKYSVR